MSSVLQRIMRAQTGIALNSNKSSVLSIFSTLALMCVMLSTGPAHLVSASQTETAPVLAKRPALGDPTSSQADVNEVDIVEINADQMRQIQERKHETDDDQMRQSQEEVHEISGDQMLEIQEQQRRSRGQDALSAPPNEHKSCCAKLSRKDIMLLVIGCLCTSIVIAAILTAPKIVSEFTQNSQNSIDRLPDSPVDSTSGASWSYSPTALPTRRPSKLPTRRTTVFPTTRAPTATPTTRAPTSSPTSLAPSALPTRVPTALPTRVPTALPTTRFPTSSPTTGSPTRAPTEYDGFGSKTGHIVFIVFMMILSASFLIGGVVCWCMSNT